MKVVSSKVLAGCFALTGFSVAVMSGLASDNPSSQILLRAVLAMLVCYVMGSIIGFICERVIVMHVEASAKSLAQAAQNSGGSAKPAPSAAEEDVIVV